MVTKEEISKAFLGLAKTADDIKQVDNDVRLYRLQKLKPIFVERDSLIAKIPSFWEVVLSQHSDFANFIRASDFAYVDCIDDLKVSWDDEGNYNITIRFKGIEGDFPAQTVIKHFKWVTIVDDLKKDEPEEDDLEEDNSEEEHDSTIERLVSEPVEIIWPTAYDNINPTKIQDKKSVEGKRNYRTGMKTLFAWFKWTGLKPGKEFPNGDALAELFAEDLYQNCLAYYTEAQRDLEDEMEDEDGEMDSAEEPLDISESELPEEEANDVKRQRVE